LGARLAQNVHTTKEGLDDLTKLRVDISKRLTKLKSAGKVVNIKEPWQRHGVKWGLVDWG